MGIGPFSRSSFCIQDRCRSNPSSSRVIVQDPRNPDPQRFRIVRIEQVGKFVIVKIQYPNCTNYEGNKVLVFEGVSIRTLKTLTAIDPHFCDSPRHLSPVARFEPTERGWSYARSLALARP